MTAGSGGGQYTCALWVVSQETSPLGNSWTERYLVQPIMAGFRSSDNCCSVRGMCRPTGQDSFHSEPEDSVSEEYDSESVEATGMATVVTGSEG